MNSASDQLGEVNTKKRQRGVGDGINQSPNPLTGLLIQLEILAPKGNDSHLWFQTRHFRNSIAVETRYIDEQVCRARASGIFHPNALADPTDVPDFSSSLDFSTSCETEFGQLLCNLPIINNPRVFQVKRRKPGSGGFHLLDLLGSDDFREHTIQSGMLGNSMKPG